MALTALQIAQDPVLFEAGVLNLLSQLSSSDVDDPADAELQVARAGRVQVRAAIITALQGLRGRLTTSPILTEVQGVDGSGLNAAGTTLTISGGQGTGTAAGGDVSLAVSPVGSSGSTANTLRTGLAVRASTTATHTYLMLWDVDNGALERVTVGAADSAGSGFKALRIPN